ncbi:MAG: magnesium transporter [Pseudomonadota bacterium]
MRTLQSVVALISALVLLVTASQALAARDLKWPDLLPKLPPNKDPLATLNAEERIELETILWVRQLTEAERAERKEIVQEAGRYEQKFRQKGIIIDRLVENYAVFDKKLTARQRKVNAKLSGETVRLTGYLLPLEFSEDGETEFLLVPYVGACIHVPPPPPNHIVLVTLSATFKGARDRWPWLAINLVTAFCATRFIAVFEDTLEQIVSLAILMPIIASIGGNTGNQTIALFIRGLALEQINRKNRLFLVRKELRISLINGLLWGALMAVVAGALYGDPALGLVMMAAMTLNLLVAATVGAGFPLLAHRLGRDPAMGGSVVLTFSTDSMGFFIFLGLATIFLL